MSGSSNLLGAAQNKSNTYACIMDIMAPAVEVFSKLNT